MKKVGHSGTTFFRSLLVTVVLLAAACAVNRDYPYPASWPPLTGGAAEDCRDFEGSYADRGDTPDFPTVNRSLTFTLGWLQEWNRTGHREDWRTADRVTVSLPSADSLKAEIWKANGEKIGTRLLTRASGEFVCDSGRATIRWHVYEAEDVATTREDYMVEFSRAGESLVAHVRNRGIGTVLLIFPVWGTTSGWVRFTRLP